MKKILITGQNSYIGMSFEKYLNQYSAEAYNISTISVRGNEWENLSFNGFDVVLHVAAIVHSTNHKNSVDVYERINHLLPIEIAKKAKFDGVKQFIFFSTMGIYGNGDKVIDAETKPSPRTLYAKSKFAAELDLKVLSGEDFIVSIIRPPIVYGKGCKGNYNKLSKFAQISIFFPNTHNKRSMIYIDNLTSFLKCIIDRPVQGIFFPQNLEYVNTFKLVKNIRETMHMPTIELKGFKKCIAFLTTKVDCFEKVFGSFCYDCSLDYIPREEYNIISFEESINRTEIK